MKNYIVHFHQYGSRKGNFVVSLDGCFCSQWKKESEAILYVTKKGK